MAWSEFLEKLAEVVDNQTSRFSSASLMLKNAKAAADSKRIIAQGEKDAQDILDGKLVVIDAEASELATKNLENNTSVESLSYKQRVLARVGHQEAKKDSNIQTVVAKAAKEIFNMSAEDIGECSKNFSEIDEDVTARIFDEIKYASREDIQNLWAKILANSITKPNEVSIDLIEFVKRINSNRAEEINSIGQFIFANNIFVKTQKVNDKSFSFWLKMQNLGLISGVESIGLIWKFSSSKSDSFLSAIPYGQKAIIISHDDAQKKPNLPCYIISDLGKEVFGLVSIEPDYEYFQEVAEIIKEENKDFTVSIVEITKMVSDNKIGQTNISFTNPVNIETKK